MAMQIFLRIVAMPLRHVFRTAHGAYDTQESLLVELREDGLCGYGEGASFSYYRRTPEMMRSSLESARGRDRGGTARRSRRALGAAGPVACCTIVSPCARWTRPPTICGARSSASRSTSSGA